MKVTPVAARGLLDRAGFLVRNRAAAGNPVELAQKLILLDRARRRIDRAVGIALLRTRWNRDGDDQRECDRAEDETQTSSKFRHLCSSFTDSVIASESRRLRIVARARWRAVATLRYKRPLFVGIDLRGRSRTSCAYDAIVSR